MHVNARQAMRAAAAAAVRYLTSAARDLTCSAAAALLLPVPPCVYQSLRSWA